MTVYFVRHGKDDGQYCGGWSSMDIIEEGKEQARLPAEYLKKNNFRLNITKIIASDLPRAASTAAICTDSLHLEVQKEPIHNIMITTICYLKNNIAKNSQSGERNPS